MATLIAVYNSEGCVGRCDSRCYNAHEPECDCICGGVNHGAGRQQAEDNTRQMAQKWLDNYAGTHDDLTSWSVPVTGQTSDQDVLSLWG